MAAERKKSISVPQRSEERVMVFYWSVKLERERHWVRFGVLLGVFIRFRRWQNKYMEPLEQCRIIKMERNSDLC